MQRKLKKLVLKVIVAVAMSIWFVGAPLIAYADTSSSETFIENSDGSSEENYEEGYGVGDNESYKILNEEDGKGKVDGSHSSKKNRLTAIVSALIILAGIMVVLLHNERAYSREALLGILNEFDVHYEDYRRYYAYCVEEYLRIERNGTEKSKNSAQAIREDMKDIYTKMLEMKKERESIVPGYGMDSRRYIKNNIDVMNTLCRKQDQYQKRLERYRNILREINRTNKINDANIVSA